MEVKCKACYLLNIANYSLGVTRRAAVLQKKFVYCSFCKKKRSKGLEG